MFECSKGYQLGLANYFNEKDGFEGVGKIFELKKVHTPAGPDDTEKSYMESQPETSEEVIRNANFSIRNANFRRLLLPKGSIR